MLFPGKMFILWLRNRVRQSINLRQIICSDSRMRRAAQHDNDAEHTQRNVPAAGQKSSSDRTNVKEPQELVVGMDMTAGGYYAITYFGLDLQFDEDAEWRLTCNDLKKSMREPPESLSIIHWGRCLWLSVDKPSLYRGQSLGPQLPLVNWTFETQKQFSSLFRNVVFTFLVISHRVGLPCEQAMSIFGYLTDFTQLSPSSRMSVSFAVESCESYPSDELRLVIPGEGVYYSLYAAKFGLGFHAKLFPLNATARDTLFFTQPQIIRSDA